MKGKIIIDLDGVLITTPSWKVDEIHRDGYSQFNEQAVNNLNELLEDIDLELWLISDRRKNKTLEEFNQIFLNRELKALVGFVPIGESRLQELQSFINPDENYILIDDDSSLHSWRELQPWWVKTQPLIGFNSEKLNEAKEIIKNWKQ